MSGMVPEELDLQGESSCLQWLHITRRDLFDPFVSQSFQRIRSEKPNVRTLTTDLEPLLRFSDQCPRVGFVCHVSRCGSTLLAAILRKASEAAVVSEPEPLSAALTPVQTGVWPRGSSDRGSFRHQIIRGVVHAYATLAPGGGMLWIKCSSLNSLFLREIRDLWPSAPIIFMYRDPTEVVISNVLRPPGWISLMHAQEMANIFFNWGDQKPPVASAAEFFSLAYAEFVRQALLVAGPQTYFLEYCDLIPENIAYIFKCAGLGGCPSREDVVKIFQTHAKYPATPFADDSALKQAAASAELKAVVEHNARREYNRLAAVAKQHRGGSSTFDQLQDSLPEQA